jgi:hypothetical protein
VNQSAANVEQEPDQPKEEQYDDDRPEYAYHLTPSTVAFLNILGAVYPDFGLIEPEISLTPPYTASNEK